MRSIAAAKPPPLTSGCRRYVKCSAQNEVRQLFASARAKVHREPRADVR